MSPADRQNQNNNKKWLAFGCFIMILFLSIVACVAGGLLVYQLRIVNSSQETSVSTDTRQGRDTLPTLAPAPTPTFLHTKTPDPEFSPSPKIEITSPTPESPTATATVGNPTPTEEFINVEDVPDPDFALALMEAEYPPRDYFESAKRLSQLDVGSRTVEAEVNTVGDILTFSTGDRELEAVLLAISDHAYFWFETSLNISQDRIEDAAERFEEEYYPTVTDLFGQEWLPGVDNDSRFNILHLAYYSGGDELGFFSSANEYPQTVSDGSNEREMFYLNMANLRLGSPLYFGTLIHEYLHLIQWHLDPNEAIWFSEGLAQFIEIYAGLDTVDTAIDYLVYPSIQLNSWNYDDEDMLLAHYGAAFLFTVYLWEQLGEGALVEMLSHPSDGLSALHHTLPLFEPERSLDQLFSDWLVANLLDLDNDNSPYGYQALNLPLPTFVKEIAELPDEYQASLYPFSADYLNISNVGEMNITFQGEPESHVFPDLPYEGDWAWFVPGINDIDAKLTTTIELPASVETTINFWTWYELEKEFDFAFLNVSTDGGESWQLVASDHAVQGPFGPAFSGKSSSYEDHIGGWIKEEISLWRYSGQEVMIRFEVLTDSTIVEGGFAIGELTFQAGADAWKEMWLSEGFVQTSSTLPKSWSVQLIPLSDDVAVVPMVLDQDNNGMLHANIDEEGAVLIVSALGPVFGKQADYQINFDKETE